MPFGIDYTGYVNYPLGAKRADEAMVDTFAGELSIDRAVGTPLGAS